MRIEAFQNIYNTSLADIQRSIASAQLQNTKASSGGDGVIVEISQEARNYAEKIDALTEIQKTEGCQTCKNRRYVDDSNDSTVSYQSPTKITPGEAASKVMAHEQEHVTNETARAEKDNRRVVSASVSIQTSICPECGKIYVSGGTTRIRTASANDSTREGADESKTTGTAGGLRKPP